MGDLEGMLGEAHGEELLVTGAATPPRGVGEQRQLPYIFRF